MKYCRYCGKTIDDDSTFCTHCGKSQEIQQTTSITKASNFIVDFFEWFIGVIKGLLNKTTSIKVSTNQTQWAKIRRWLKRIFMTLLCVVALGLLILLGFWLYGFYQTNKWEKEDERRESIALKDITKADEIARELFKEYANGSHRYDFDGTCCDFRHIEKGIEILRNAAEKGNADAQFTLGCIYAGARYDLNWKEWDEEYTMMYTGIDHERAAYWYSQASAQGVASAMGNLANSYRYGRGVEKDLVKATELMKAAADKGNSWAQLNYGDMFRDGEIWMRAVTDSVKGESFLINAKPNIEKAKEWWLKALENGNEQAKERLEKLYE